MPLIQVSCLGQMGRWGNQLFQYAFARGYAEAHRCELQTPPWLGQLIFENVNDPPLDRKLPRTDSDLAFPDRLGAFFGRTDLDLRGFFQHQLFLDYYTREQVRRWFTVKPELEAICGTPGFSASAIHPRFYQLGEDQLYCNINLSSYTRALKRWSPPPPVFWVSAGWREPLSRLLAIADERLAIDAHYRSLGFLADFLFLRDAAVLLRANSSFSWWAATLGVGRIYSPVVGDKTGVQDVDFVPGNWPNLAGGFPNQSDLHLKEK